MVELYDDPVDDQEQEKDEPTQSETKLKKVCRLHKTRFRFVFLYRLVQFLLAFPNLSIYLSIFLSIYYILDV